MKRLVALVLLMLLPAGCAGTPQSRDAGSTAVVSVLGAEPAGEELRLLAAAEGRGEKGPFHCDSRGATPAAAVEGLTNKGKQVVSCAHVEHLLLTHSAAGALPALLSYAFQEPQQSTETQLWVVRTDTLESTFSEEADVAKRMTVIKAQGKNRQHFYPMTLRQAAAALAGGESLLIPALDAGEQGLSFAGYALYQKGRITQWLTEQQALGASLLLGERVHWTGSGETGALLLQNVGCRAKAQWDGNRLCGLTLRCRLEGVPTGGWTGEGAELVRLEEKTAQGMLQAMKTLQQAGADAAGLLGRAGLSSPFRWEALSEQWREVFPVLPVQIAVDITVAERQ